MRSLFVASFFAFVAILFPPTAGASGISWPFCRRRAQSSSTGAAARPPPTHPNPIQEPAIFTAAQFLEIEASRRAALAGGNDVTHAVPDWVHQVEPCRNWENDGGPDTHYAQGMNGNRAEIDMTDLLPRWLESAATAWLPSLLEPRVTLYRGTTVSDFRRLQQDIQQKGRHVGNGRYGKGLYFTTDPAVAWAYGRKWAERASERAKRASKTGHDDPAAVVLEIAVRPRQLECWAPHKAVLKNEEDRVWPFLEFVLRQDTLRQASSFLRQAEERGTKERARGAAFSSSS